jgi:hypothetical protein
MVRGRRAMPFPLVDRFAGEPYLDGGRHMGSGVFRSGWARLGTALAAVALGMSTPIVGAPARAAAPLTITGARAVQNPDGMVTISWTVNGSHPARTGFRIERVESGRSIVVATVPATAGSAEDPLTGVATGGHTYRYEIAALAGADAVASTTTFPPTIYKNVPSGPPLVDVTTSGSQVRLAWTGPQVNARLLTGYRVGRRIDS